MLEKTPHQIKTTDKNKTRVQLHTNTGHFGGSRSGRCFCNHKMQFCFIPEMGKKRWRIAICNRALLATLRNRASSAVGQNEAAASGSKCWERRGTPPSKSPFIWSCMCCISYHALLKLAHRCGAVWLSHCHS